jgi:hypothetical protein
MARTDTELATDVFWNFVGQFPPRKAGDSFRRSLLFVVAQSGLAPMGDR